MKITKEFLNHVKENKDRIAHMVGDFSQKDILRYRNFAAEQGHEFTPKEIEQYFDLLCVGLLMIQNGWEDDLS